MKRNDVNRSAFRGRRENSTIVDFNYCVEDKPVIEPSHGPGNDGQGGTGDTVTENTENGEYPGGNKIIHVYSIV